MLPKLQTEPTLTVQRAADVLGISRAAAYRAVKHGTIPSLRFGRTIRVPTGPLLALLGLTAEGRGSPAEAPELRAVE